MDDNMRRRKINELKAKVLLHEIEHSALVKELRSMKTSTGRRAEIYRRQPLLYFEHTEALNDLEWLYAEEKIRRPDREFQFSIV